MDQAVGGIRNVSRIRESGDVRKLRMSPGFLNNLWQQFCDLLQFHVSTSSFQGVLRVRIDHREAVKVDLVVKRKL